ncbi:MAG: hypothetical protein ACK5HP_04885 [Bacilli bacterium]
MKKISYIITFLILMFGLSVNVSATAVTFNGVTITLDGNSANEFNLYCQYFDGTYILIQKDLKDTNAYIETGNALLNSKLYFEDSENLVTEEQLIKAGFISNTTYVGDCPLYVYGEGEITLQNIKGFSNSVTSGSGYNVVLLDTSTSECANTCSIKDQQTTVEASTFSCNYKGQESGEIIKIDAAGSNHTITLPDGSILNNYNMIYSEECPDIYYVKSAKIIKTSVSTNSSISNNSVLGNLCNSYNDEQIEHFCSGICEYSEMICPIDTDLSCNMFGDETLSMIKTAYNLVKLAAPILVVILGIIDFLGVILTGEDKSFKEVLNKSIKRLVAAIILIFVPILVEFFLNISGLSSQYEFLNCLLN